MQIVDKNLTLTVSYPLSNPQSAFYWRLIYAVDLYSCGNKLQGIFQLVTRSLLPVQIHW